MGRDSRLGPAELRMEVSPAVCNLLAICGAKGGRGDWIRTSDPSVPNRVLYQTEPRPDELLSVTCSPMPIYEYACRSCGHEFEQLIRTGDTAACPSCKGQDLERLLSQVSVSSEHTRQLNFNKARAKAKLAQRDKDVAQAEYEKKHREEGH
jgi:putative FmdB family regulatory protein